MHPVMRLIEETIAGGSPEMALPALPRMIFVVHGFATIEGKRLHDGEAWGGESAAAIQAGREGVTLWRFEVAPGGSTAAVHGGPGVRSREKLSAVLETIPAGDLLLRGDSVAFPPGGCAFLHKHAGPGLRCLIEGGIRIDTAGHSNSYGPGSAWFENGVEPVFAQAAADRDSRFIRCMVLPRDLLGKSSFQYVNEEDKTKPRVQQYKGFVDLPIARPKE